MVRRSVVGVALAMGLLAGCQPAERGGGAGGEASRMPAAHSETAGEHFEEAYTNLAEVHISLVRGDWESANEHMRDVRENLDAMKHVKGEPLPAVETNQINELQRSVVALDQLIASRNPQAVADSRTLMTTFTRESTLAQLGQSGGGAGTAPREHR